MFIPLLSHSIFAYLELSVVSVVGNETDPRLANAQNGY